MKERKTLGAFDVLAVLMGLLVILGRALPVRAADRRPALKMHCRPPHLMRQTYIFAEMSRYSALLTLQIPS